MNRGRGPIAALLGLVALAACAAPGFEEYTERPGPYDALSPVELRVLQDARALQAAGELELARRRLMTLCAALPDNLVAAVALQEVELALLAAGEELPELATPGAAPLAAGALDPVQRLYPRYAGRAETYGTAAAAILAARLAPDEATADAWIERALASDPRCVWAYYARAFGHAAASRYGPAWEELARALAIDPGHPPARRLEAMLLTRRGEIELATDAWRIWLRTYGGDPRIAPVEEATAHRELANLLVQGDDPAGALAVLDALGASAEPDLEASMVRAVALDAVGRVGEALAVVRAAAEAAPADPRPRVQEALLLADRLGDAEGARAAWEDVLRRLDAEPAADARATAAARPGVDPAAGELMALLLRLQANASLARLDAERATADVDE